MQNRNIEGKNKSELEEANEAEGAALTVYEDLTRGFTKSKGIFIKMFWYMVEGVEGKLSVGANACLLVFAETVEPAAYPNFPYYKIVRKFYLDGLKDTDRARTADVLRKDVAYKFAELVRPGCRQNKERELPPTDAATIEATYREYCEAIENDPAAVKLAWETYQEKKSARVALEEKAKEKPNENGLFAEIKEARKAGITILKKVDKDLTAFEENALKRFKIARGGERRTTDNTPNPPDNDNNPPGNERKQIKRLF